MKNQNTQEKMNSFDAELEQSLSIQELEQRLEMVTASCEYGNPRYSCGGEQQGK